MAYNSRHSIFLQDNDKQKLMFIKSLFDEDGICFVIKDETVYHYDGEPFTVTCLSDINWNSGEGYVWYDFEYDMERISEKFNRKYPNDVISIYVKTEDGFENLYEFRNGSMSSDEEIIHYQMELRKVCEELNLMASETPLQLYEVIDIARHPTIVFHYGAYTFIGYNIYEIYSHDNYSFDITAVIAFPSRNYDNLPYRIKAQQILYNNLLEKRAAGRLGEYT